MDGSTVRTRLPVDERRNQLLSLGISLFSGRSFDQVSIEEIAAAAGVSKGLLYHYFGSKREFYVECVRWAGEQLLARIEPDWSLPREERIRAGLNAYLDYVDELSEAYATLLRGGIGSDPEVLEVVEGTRMAIVDEFLHSMAIEERRPIFRNAVRGWIGMTEAASLDWVEHRDVPRDALVTLLTNTLVATVTTAMALDPEAGAVLPE